MTARKACICCVLSALGFIFHAHPVYAQSNANEGSTVKQSQDPIAPGPKAAVGPKSSDNDHSGQNDFHFEVGTWKIHLN